MYNHPPPADIPTKADGKPISITEVEKWRSLFCRHNGTEEAVKESMAKLYERILWKQCDGILQNKIKSDKKFAKVESGSDIIGLLEILEVICMSRDMTNYYPLESTLTERNLQSF